MDADGHIAEARMAEALQGLHRVCPYVRFLGSYPKARYGSQDATKTNALDSARPGTSDADYEAARAWFDEIIKGRGV
jgi:prephenate dehydratase